MPSAVIVWLDYSQADQRPAREIAAMFSHAESRNEPGLGQIRDALSDTLFPRTSVLLTRARYLLFVPWIYREDARRGHQVPLGGEQVLQQAHERCTNIRRRLRRPSSLSSTC